MSKNAHITLKTVLEHVQHLGSRFDQRMDHLDWKVDTLATRMQQGFTRVDEKLEVIDLRIIALEEDLLATMQLQDKHGKKLAKLSH